MLVSNSICALRVKKEKLSRILCILKIYKISVTGTIFPSLLYKWT